MPAFYLLLVACALYIVAVGIFVGAFLLWTYSEKRAYREPRTIICPENLQYAAITVDGAHAARTMASGREELRIAACSRWPEKQGCDQGCAIQAPLVGDDRTHGKYAAFGMTPAQMRIYHPVRMTRAMYARIGGR